jgi:glutathione S-transferase
MYQLYIGNKNYSSWSLRPWVLMKTLGIPFEERFYRFSSPEWGEVRKVSPTGRVPCLVDGDTTVWDSLAVTEYLAERHPGVWPGDAVARAWARSAAAEMHSGFSNLRSICTMNVGVRVELAAYPDGLKAEVDRIGSLWNEGLDRFGGPFLAGETFGAADAFYCPVAFRVQTYGLKLNGRAAGYAERLLALPAMKEWYEAGIAEDFRDEPHEIDARAAGRWVRDLRAGA